jgi:hypothetical protein
MVCLSLCFGKSSLLFSFLKEWVNHTYENRLIYISLQAADPSCFTKLLSAIDDALQNHWRSCSNAEDYLPVNDWVLLTSDIQESILCHNL